MLNKQEPHGEVGGERPRLGSRFQKLVIAKYLLRLTKEKKRLIVLLWWIPDF
jgi:hypothetical protein